MKDSIIALVDCDSFFVSCEQSVDESLQGKPVCVVGGERGCVLARSKEAKKLGVKMGMPYFMAKKEFPEAIYVKAKMGLYKDFSRKVMAILRDFSPTVEVYSIDEAFVELSGLKRLHKCNYYQIAKKIKDEVKSQLGISVSVGLSRSKVLAKLACEKAKDSGGIYLIGKSKIPNELKSTRIEEIWGIGQKTGQLLNRWGIMGCDRLVEKSDEWLKIKVGKRGVELKHELLGECLDKVKLKRKLPKSIQNTRSFPEFTSDINYIKNALNIHIHTSCTKLRYLKGKCRGVSIMLRTKDFMIYGDKINLKKSINFEIEISKKIMEMLEKIYSPNVLYRSCGITLENIDYDKEEQMTLFPETSKLKNCDKLAESIDRLECKFGRNIVKTGFFKTE